MYYHNNRRRYRRVIWVAISLFIMLLSLIVAPVHQPAAVSAASSDPGLSHCTDWNKAKVSDPGSPTPDVDTAFRIIGTDHIGINDPGLTSFLPEATETITDSVWNTTGWRVLIRPNQPFAVFYSTADPVNNDRVFDGVQVAICKEVRP